MVSDDEAETIARRLSVLELANKLCNVSEACRRTGVGRPSYYIWKRRYEENGLEGLRDLSRIPHSHPAAIPQGIRSRILTLSLRHPQWGCSKISDFLRHSGVRVSSPTVQKTLISHGLASTYDRAFHLERLYFEKALELTPEQIGSIERANPEFRERNSESPRAGDRLCQAVKALGTIPEIGRIFAHFVVDTYGSYGFVRLHSTKLPEVAIDLLENCVIPAYREWGVSIRAICTSTASTFSSAEDHPYQDFLWLNDIEHWKDKVRGGRNNGFVERFVRTLRSEFAVNIGCSNTPGIIEEFQRDLDQWLHYYNHQRPHQGYRNMGKTPAEFPRDFKRRLIARDVR